MLDWFRRGYAIVPVLIASKSDLHDILLMVLLRNWIYYKSRIEIISRIKVHWRQITSNRKIYIFCTLFQNQNGLVSLNEQMKTDDCSFIKYELNEIWLFFSWNMIVFLNYHTVLAHKIYAEKSRNLSETIRYILVCYKAINWKIVRRYDTFEIILPDGAKLSTATFINNRFIAWRILLPRHRHSICLISRWKRDHWKLAI